MYVLVNLTQVFTRTQNAICGYVQHVINLLLSIMVLLTSSIHVNVENVEMTTPPIDSPTDSSSVLTVERDSDVPNATFKCSECKEICEHYTEEFALVHDRLGPMWTLGFYVCLLCGAHRVKKYARND
jgi:hypothetical protein